MNKKAMYKLSYGLFVLSAREGEKDNGCIINTAGQVTGTPNRISIAVNKENYTHDMILRTGKFNLSIISQAADFALFKRFGFASGRDTDKFADWSAADYARGANGIYMVKNGTNAFLSGAVWQSLDLGSHTLFIADVTDMEVLSDSPSATYDYYQSSIKPKPEAAGAGTKGETVWRCVICGYEHVGEELPDDFICPICKHPKSDFEKIVR